MSCSFVETNGRGRRSERVTRALTFPRSALPRLEPEEEADLGRRHHRGDVAAGHRLIEAHLSLAVAFATRRAWIFRKRRENSVGLEDLVSAAYVGLCRAVRTWDPDRQVRFGTLAAIVVSQEIALVAVSGRSQMAGGQKHVNMLSELHRARETFAQAGCDPSREDLAAHLRWSLATLDAFLRLLAGEVAFDPMYDGSLMPEPARYVDPDARTPEETLGDLEERARFREAFVVALEKLLPREREVLQMRYLDHDEDGLRTLADVGGELSYTRERVRQIEKEALRKMKKHLKTCALVTESEVA